MQYRKFGQVDFKVSALGFGAMRFPVNNDDYSDIVEDEAIKMMRYAIDRGVNYIDTAWPYHQGSSELVVAKALKDGYREKVKVATKLPSWEIKEEKDMDKYLNKQLEKLEIECIDFYLLHALNKERWEKYKELNVFDWIEKIIDEGKIEHIGFSFHGEYEVFEEIIDAYDWDFCQIQYNYLDEEYQAGKKGMKYAYEKGIAVIIMEPLRGGTLAVEPPKEVKEVFNKSKWVRTPADWALQWLWDQEEVSLVLSGMSNMQQVKENIESADKSAINKFSDEERDIIDNIKDRLRGPITCTRCGYCMPCPNGVDIPQNFFLYNEAEIYDKSNENKERYQKLDSDKKAENCIRCGKCEPACPQNLKIMDLLEDVAAALA
ncbi:aldo/keto reductase [Natronospora cellulosivora (SeqCode)]